jgi:Asp-tRNA(Asn)/Glu-tRNA(Gln) amidotransferase A subunit family amidase
MVPVALGTQTYGSVIRPASYCGVYAYKPSSGLIPRTGVLDQSPSLDQVGVFARSIEDLALVGEVLAGDDGHDATCARQAPMRMHAVAASTPPLPPKFCFVRTPWWDQIEPEAREAYEAFLDHMGDLVVQVELPAIVTRTVEWLATVNNAELAFCLQSEWNGSRSQLSDRLRKRVEQGRAISAIDYLTARDRIPHTTGAFDEYFEIYDAILCPAALGAAPAGLASTGDPIMQTVWSFAGLPSMNLPLLNLSSGLPLGVQAVAAHKNDARLMRSARWLVGEFLKRNEA